MKASELRQYTDEELNEKLEEKKKELMNLRFQLALKQLDNTNLIKTCKRDIARFMTILTERALGIKR